MDFKWYHGLIAGLVLLGAVALVVGPILVDLPSGESAVETVEAGLGEVVVAAEQAAGGDPVTPTPETADVEVSTNVEAANAQPTEEPTEVPTLEPTVAPEPSVCDAEEVMPEGLTEYGEHASDFLYSYGNWTDLNGNHLYFGTTWDLVPCEELTDQDYSEVLPPVYSVRDGVNLYLRVLEACDASVVPQEGQSLPNDLCGEVLFIVDRVALEEALGVDFYSLFEGRVDPEIDWDWGSRYIPWIARTGLPGETFEQRVDAFRCVWPDESDVRVADYFVGGNWNIVWRTHRMDEHMGFQILSINADPDKISACE